MASYYNTKNVIKANYLVRVSHRSLIKSQIKYEKKGGSGNLTCRFYGAPREKMKVTIFYLDKRNEPIMSTC